MNRHYDTADYRRLCKKLRECFNDCTLTTDIMVGFPGETEEAFSETYAFCEEARFLDMHVFAYSRRKNTPAAEMDGQVEESVKRERSAALIALREKMRREVLASLVEDGQPLSVIFETEEDGYYMGHSDEFVPVRVEASEALHGLLERVLPVAVREGIVYGNIIQD